MLISLGAAASSSHAADKLDAVVEVDHAWEAVFTRTEGWNGGDVAGTVDLGEGRTLWLFGDTLHGQVADDKRLPGNVMVSNSAAAHAGPSPQAPSPSDVAFLFGPRNDQGKVTALFPSRDVGANERSDVFTDKEDYWPSGGGYVAEVAGKRQLVVGLFRVRRTKEPGPFGFRRVGNALGIVDDVGAEPASWRPRIVAIPHAVGDDEQTDDRASVSWGEVFLRQDDERRVLIYGVRSLRRGPRELVAARAPLDVVEQFDQWEFLGPHDAWTKDATSLKTILIDIGPEFSLEPIKHGDFAGYVLVQNEPMLGAGIWVRTAQNPLGPWSPPREAYRPSGPAEDKDLFSYAAKGHIALSPHGELLISYIISSHDFWRLFREAGLYRPRFVRVPLREIIKP